jgi:hypothetical protein
MSTGTFGGFAPFPRRYGGNTSPIKAILDSLNLQMGTGYNTDINSSVYVQNYAIARAIWSAWALNNMLSLQGQPLKMTAFLNRVEKYLSLPMDPSLNDTQRRQRIQAVYAKRGQDVDQQFITDGLIAAMDGVFVQLEFISFANAVIHVPDGTYPWGTVADGFPWYSTVQHILILTQKPTNWSEGQYREAVGRGSQFIDPVLPADCTYTFYHAPEGRVAINTPGGPSMAGFYLDTPNSLDYNVFA